MTLQEYMGGYRTLQQLLLRFTWDEREVFVIASQ